MPLRRSRNISQGWTQFQSYPFRVLARSTRIVEDILLDLMSQVMSCWQIYSSSLKMYQFSLKRLTLAMHQSWANKCRNFVQDSYHPKEVFTLSLRPASQKKIAFTASQTYRWARLVIDVLHPWTTLAIENLLHLDSELPTSTQSSYIRHSQYTKLKSAQRNTIGWAQLGWHHVPLLKSTRTASIVDSNREVRIKSAQVYMYRDL